MVRPLSLLPNLITLSNLFLGCMGVVWAFELDLERAVYMIWICAVLDVLDGLAARAVGVASELGKQLDSLADLVSFGLLPSAILYTLWLSFIPTPWAILSFLITVFSALRLAKFNLDPDQGTNFKGLPTPATALLISSFPMITDQNIDIIRLGLENQVFWFLIVGLLCYLMVSNVPLIGFKFKNFSWNDNKHRYFILGCAVTLIAFLGTLGIPWILFIYIGISLVWQNGQN
ncbi:MAG: CDP-diacylglycerol--serine O-phosphatidyltransferase [Cyclobacteriaceae bacterium]|nr:MAG: CDP-diacylglycerol--serine O-phosphatidyltransferase [Cyclobacteriaceae bacterium]